MFHVAVGNSTRCGLAVGALAVGFVLQVGPGLAPDAGIGFSVLLPQPDEGQVLLDPLFAGEPRGRLRGSRQLDHGVRRRESALRTLSRVRYSTTTLRPTRERRDSTSCALSPEVPEEWTPAFSSKA